MLILAIDCAGSGCGVCVWRDGAILASAFESMERGQDQRLMPLVLSLMQEAGVTFELLDRIAVTRGPGSFTGLRIGLAAARGIGLAAGKPVIGIDRFAIYHEALKFSGDHLIVINSRRDELYCRFYPAGGPAQADAMMTENEIKQLIKSRHSRESGNPESASARHATPESYAGYRSSLDFRFRGNDIESDVIISGDTKTAGFTGFRTLDEPEHVVCARLAAAADPQKPEHSPRPLYIRAPDVTMPKITGKETLRRLTLGESASLADLHAESFGAARWSRQQIESSLALDTTRGWGIFDAGEMAGFVLCQIIPGQSEVLTFCVRPALRRRGFGEKLLRAAADAARQTGSALYLEVAADNLAALALYAKAGFARTGSRSRYYKRETENMDAVLLTLPFQS